MPKYEDLTGQRFGRLTAIEATDKKLMEDECGNVYVSVGIFIIQQIGL